MGTGDFEILAPVIVLIFVTLVVGGVILLKPLANRLGLLLETMARQRTDPRIAGELGHMRELLERLDGRVSLLEERQDFTDALLTRPQTEGLRPGPAADASGDEAKTDQREEQ